MVQKNFAARAVAILQQDQNITGVAAAGSWITDEMDEFSDLDLIIVTKEKITDDKLSMVEYANRLGSLLSSFTGEHVGEPRVLICLYDNPLLHVDLKFVTIDEFRQRIETPVLLLDKDDALGHVLKETEPLFPYPDYQWIEDRFWTWIHYALLKIGRGEYTEALDFFGFLRMVVFGPLLHIKNGNLPRGVRKVETQLPAGDLQQLKETIPLYAKDALLQALQHSIALYRQLRKILFGSEIAWRTAAENRVMQYFEEMKQKG